MTQLIHVAATLGVADLMCDGPKHSHELAASLKVDPEALYRVLRALASIGIFEEADPGCFALTTQAEPLRRDVPGSLRASAILYGEPWFWRACGDLLHSVRTGQPAFDHVHGESLFAYLDHAAGCREGLRLQGLHERRRRRWARNADSGHPEGLPLDDRRSFRSTSRDCRREAAFARGRCHWPLHVYRRRFL